MASNAIEDKASAASMMSFINMGLATLSVVVMGNISSDPFYSLLWMLAIVFVITLCLLVGYQIRVRAHQTNF